MPEELSRQPSESPSPASPFANESFPTPPPADVPPPAEVPPPAPAGFPGPTGEKPGKPGKPAKPGGNPFTKQRRFTLLRNILVGTLAVAAIFGAGWWYFKVYNRSGILILDPGDNVTIKLNNRPVKTRKDPRGIFIQTSAGNYQLTISKPSYLPYTQNIRLGRGKIAEIRPAFTILPAAIARGASATTSIDYVRPSRDEKTVFFLGDNRQRIYRMEIANQVQIRLTERPLQGVSDMQWSAEPDVALVTLPDGVYLHEIPYYDFVTQTLVKIGGRDVLSPVWDPTNSQRLAFGYYPASGEKSLAFADKYLQKIDRKADISGIPNPKIVWSPDASALLILGRSEDRSRNNIWLYTTGTGALTQLTKDGGITNATFGPNSDIILLEQVDSGSDNPLASTLSYMPVDGSEIIPLRISGKVDKAAWRDSRSFYLPDSTSNTLTLNTVERKPDIKRIPFNFSDTVHIQGMFYYPSSKTLIFYTTDAIYTLNLALE
jgi:hypothetical protein